MFRRRGLPGRPVQILPSIINLLHHDQLNSGPVQRRRRLRSARRSRWELHIYGLVVYCCCCHFVFIYIQEEKFGVFQQIFMIMVIACMSIVYHNQVELLVATKFQLTSTLGWLDFPSTHNGSVVAVFSTRCQEPRIPIISVLMTIIIV